MKLNGIDIVLVSLMSAAVGCALGMRLQRNADAPAPVDARCDAGVQMTRMPDVSETVDAGVVPTPAVSAEWQDLGIRALFERDDGPEQSQWVAANGEPLPEMVVWRGRPGSKTPYNLRVWGDGLFFAGCGLYGDGEAYCQVHDAEHRDVPRAVRTLVTFQRRGEFVRVSLSGEFAGDFVSGVVKREGSE